MNDSSPNNSRCDDRNSQHTHPMGSRARVLLVNVFGPYAQDDEYGSRKSNPMELFHNQVTRVQGPFSLRIFNRSWGLMLIQKNIEAPCTLLDFPTLERFIKEIRDNHYDIVGISSIMVNVLKVKKMCALVRSHLPHAVIVVGGHISNLSDLAKRIDADHIVKGEGIRWFRHFLSEDPDRPIRHPQIYTNIGTRVMGARVRLKPEDEVATLIPSVGCPQGCNFCSTSAMFGGKGKFVNFYETGDELFDIMCQLESSMKVRSFFVMDENFLMHRRRALRLLELMESHDKAWSLHVFSSAKVLESYTIEQFVSMGISWIWTGLEGEDSQYTKLNGVDTLTLVRELRSNGIRVLGSSIIGLENHTPQNIDQIIEYAVCHNSDFHQFMLYMPLPGTPLYDEISAKKLLKHESELPLSDQHGQFTFNYRHPHIKNGVEEEFLLRAFRRDFEINGPSIVRAIHTGLNGWKRYKNHPNERIRRRIIWESRELARTSTAVVAAAKSYYRENPVLYDKMSALLEDLFSEFGPKARRVADLAGPLVLERILEEEHQLGLGRTYEPPSFYEKNDTGENTPDKYHTTSRLI